MNETQSRPAGKYWFWFFIWLVIIIIMLADVGGSRKFFWLALPGVCTYLGKALNILDDNSPADLEY
jgi:hypothetical protein